MMSKKDILDIVIPTEKLVLGSMLGNNSLIRTDLDESLFTNEKHRIIYLKIKEIVNREESFDIAILRSELKEIIDTSYIDGLIVMAQNQTSFSSEALEKNIEILKDGKHDMSMAVEDVLCDVAENSVENEEVIFEGYDIESAFNLYIKNYKHEGEGITLGYPALDGAIGGLRFGEVLTFEASTSVGKTWWALNVLTHMSSKFDLNIGYFSFDDSLITIVERLLQLSLDKSVYEIREMRKKNKILGVAKIIKEKYPRLKIYDCPFPVDKVLVISKMNNLKIIFIDYLGLVGGQRSGIAYERISNNITELKQMAKVLNALVITMHQLSRKSESGTVPVTLNMGRDSGVVEEDSSFVLGAYRPDLKQNLSENEKKGLEDLILIQLLKNKRGINRIVPCHFDKKTGRIEEKDEEFFLKKMQEDSVGIFESKVNQVDEAGEKGETIVQDENEAGMPSEGLE